MKEKTRDNPRGAGRPLSTSKQLQKSDQQRLQLHIKARAGWDRLADKYPDLMDKAIELAMDGDRMMHGKLLELMPRVVGSDNTSESPTTGILARLKDRINGQPINLHQYNVEGDLHLGADGQGRDEAVGGGTGS